MKLFITIVIFLIMAAFVVAVIYVEAYKINHKD